jgi:ribosomal protein S18 acetylase RimI-like enzyme
MIDLKDRAPIVEASGRGNVRFIGYNLLKNVQFDNQPVVPKILREKNDELIGPIFEVENLPGVDLDELIQSSSISYLDKLSVLSYVAGQLEAIDQAGFIPFDRSGSNIRVLSYGDNGISTRQIDIEDIYDRAGDCLYSKEGSGMTDEVLDTFRNKDINFWARNVTLLTELSQVAADIADDQLALSEFEKLKWPLGNPNGSTLAEFREAIDNRKNHLLKNRKTDYNFVELPAKGYEGFRLVNYQNGEVAATESCIRVTNFGVFPGEISEVLKHKDASGVPVFMGSISVDSGFTRRGIGPAIWKATVERLVKEHPTVIISHVDDSIPYGWTSRRIPEEVKYMSSIGYDSEVIFQGQTDNRQTTVIQYSPTQKS